MSDEIIAGLIQEGKISWYVSTRPFWIMDHRKWKKAFEDAGFNLQEDSDKHKGRFGIAVLNQESLPEFLRGMAKYKVDLELLSLAFLALDPPDSSEDLDWTEDLDRSGKLEYLFPSLLLDFDRRQLLSIDREDYPHEKYMAEGWTFRYVNFTSQVPEKDRYWIVNGTDYFADSYK